MYSRYRTYLFFTLSNCLLALGGCLGTTTATAPLASDYFGRKMDFGFATGYVLAFNGRIESQGGKFDGGTGFAIAPDVMVTVGHISFGRTDADRIIFGNGPLPTPVRTLSGGKLIINLKPLCVCNKPLCVCNKPLCVCNENDAGDLAKQLPGGPWTYGRALKLQQPKKKEGDLAIIRLEKQLPQWDRHIDPTLHPEVGDIVVVGSKRGREDDRVLRVISKPIHCRLFGSVWGGLPSDLVFAESGMIHGWSGAPVKAQRHSTTADDDGTWYTFGYVVGVGTITVILPLPEDILEYVPRDEDSKEGGPSRAGHPPKARVDMGAISSRETAAQ